MHIPQHLPPAQLWIGNHDDLVNHTYEFLQKIVCPHGGCHTCITCMHIRDKQHHAIMWFYPEKTYTIELLEDLFTTASFQLEEDTHFFFILQKAHYLSTACANKLLKIMEEPPTGYHFILLADHTEDILPTIISRCIVTQFTRHDARDTHPLIAGFTHAPLV